MDCAVCVENTETHFLVLNFDFRSDESTIPEQGDSDSDVLYILTLNKADSVAAL